MADDTLKPMTVEDIAAATGDTLQPSDSLKNAPDSQAAGDEPAGNVALAEASATGGATSGASDEGADDGEPRTAKQLFTDGAAKLRGEAGDRARTLVDEGKLRATGALDQLSQMLNDAAGQVDEKLGGQYGQYARTAAERVQGFSSSLNDRNVDDLIDDARELVRKSPAVAIGTAAAFGFVVARLLSAGLDQRDQG